MGVIPLIMRENGSPYYFFTKLLKILKKSAFGVEILSVCSILIVTKRSQIRLFFDKIESVSF